MVQEQNTSPVNAGNRHELGAAQGGAADQRALPSDRQNLIVAVEHLSPVRRARLWDLLAKKSRSTVSCPILACSFSISRYLPGLGVPAGAHVKRAGRVFQKLLLSGVNPVGVNLVALRQLGDRRLPALAPRSW
jgi:hypothetical protein